MRNITFLPILVIIILLFSVNFPGYCEESEQLTENNEQITENDNIFVNHEETAVNKTSDLRNFEKKQRKYGFSIGPQFGFVNGQAIEVVYPTDTKGEYLSELLWNMKPIYYLGIYAELGLNDKMSHPGFFSSLSFKAGIPGDSGIHENRDWMSFENASLTHYSQHTNKTNVFFMADVLIGASIPLFHFYIKPFINTSWLRFSFSGRDGLGVYAKSSGTYTYHPINNDPSIYSFSGEVITYEQHWFLIAPGISFGTNILSPFTFNLSFQGSPFTYCAAIDHHLTRKDTFYDFTGWGVFMEGGGNISFCFKFLELSFDYTYRYIGNTMGDSYILESKNEYAFLSKNKAGAGLLLSDTRVMVRVRL